MPTQTQMLLNRIKGSHNGLVAGGILKLDSETIIGVSMNLLPTVYLWMCEVVF